MEIMNMNQPFDLAANIHIPDTIEETSDTLSGSLGAYNSSPTTRGIIFKVVIHFLN
jgi:hypothetical protein